MALTISPLRISTTTATADWGLPIQLDVLFEQLKEHFIPIGYPAPGILKFEHKKEVYGACHKDLFTNRKMTAKSFYNQSTLVLRRPFGLGWKEVNMKLFGSGVIQMTGISSLEFAIEAVQWLLSVIKRLPKSPFVTTEKEPSVTKATISMINTDYSLNYDVQQENLNRILMEEYGIFSMLEKTIYQGVNAKFFYNTANKKAGVCSCTGFCKGQGIGEGIGQCKRITMSIFRTGNIIITGGRNMKQIEMAYDFLNEVFRKHAATVLIKRA
jgi:TATA-box binding protein (TBP) (component of TFIID and TFIIIB)